MSHPGDAQGFPPGAPVPVPAAAGAAQQWGQAPSAAYPPPPAPVGTAWAPPTAPPPAPTPPGLPFGLTPADILESLRTVARAFLPALAALTVLSAVVALVA